MKLETVKPGIRRCGVRGLCGLLAAAVLSAVCTPAMAQVEAKLGPENVLVVYDSRNNDSLLIAEHYAGSAAVAGGVGSVTGARPGVLVFDLGTTALAESPADGTISAARFRQIRNFIRDHLNAAGLREQVRVLVLTKGVPHRVRDHDSGNGGDSPSNQGTQWNQFDATSASVDSELTLLWQDVDDGENGLPGDSQADGVIVNPFWQSADAFPIETSTDADAAKSYDHDPPQRGGQIWIPDGEGPAQLSPADMVLVCRLDGKTVDDVRAMIDRAGSFVYDLSASAMIFDEANSNGEANPFPSDAELDNQVPAVLRASDDYETARDAILADGRFTGRLEYNALSGAGEFVVGPSLDFGGGIVVAEPVIYLASEGANHRGGEPSGPDGAGGERYAESFTYAPGAIFNTIESYNGRAFGTLGTLSAQEQLSDFIEAGGTFGIGHVWEPFAFTIADNVFIVQNFVLGEMTWAEAAWSSIPVLSWQHVVLGDPLARVRCSRADLNGDGALNNTDINLFVNRFLAGDTAADVNADGFFNNTDVNSFVTAFLAGCG